MTRTTQNRVPGQRSNTRLSFAAAILGLSLAAAGPVQAQQAIGVPFVGRNHLSFSVTELSRDGVGQQRAAVFGGIYGRRIGRDNAPVQYTVIVRTAMRSLDGTEDGIVDAGATFAATHAVAALNGLSLSAAAGAGATVWGEQGLNGGVRDKGRIVAKLPLSAGVAYDVRLGRATVAPFATLTGAYSRERDYVNNDRVASGAGWRVGHTAGVSVRFREAVLSLSGVNRDRGLPQRTRTVFSAGMSW